VLNERLVLPQFAGYTAQQYVLESIVVPGAYTVEGYAAGLMPANYGQITSAQDLADIVAYLNSTDPNYVPPAPAEEATTMEAASAAP
jgi:type VI protein secretion system component VasK